MASLPPLRRDATGVDGLLLSSLDVDLGQPLLAVGACIRDESTLSDMRNPFLSDHKLLNEARGLPTSSCDRERREQTLVALRALTAKHVPVTYAIGTAGNTVVRVLLNKVCFRVGEDISAWLDFTGTNAHCLQVLRASCEVLNLY